MNTNEEKNDGLDALLREWSVDSSLPPRFGREVWGRIAHVQSQAAPDFCRLFAAWLESLFSRPAMVVSYIAILLLAGIVTGFCQVKDKSAESEAQWRARYVQFIDPYQMPRN